jgi:hypothetical protein
MPGHAPVSSCGMLNAEMAKQRHIVSVQAEYDSEFYLSPMAFDDFSAALFHAIGIAKSWVDSSVETPLIRIVDDKGRCDDWSLFGLISISYFFE